MRVVVTGSAGFIGREVMTALDARGHDVAGFDVRDDPHDDITDRSRCTAAFARADVVVHLAAKVGLGVALSDMDDYARLNDLGTAVVLSAAAAAGVSRVVFASSMVVYGDGRYRCPVHGDVAAGPRSLGDLRAGHFDPGCPVCGAVLEPGLVPESAPMDPRNTYAATKVHGEHLGQVFARETGGSVLALRLHNVYGPGMPLDTPYAGVAALFRSQLADGGPPLVFEDGRQRRDFVHVDDVAASCASAVAAPVPAGLTALNIGSGRVSTIGEMAATLSRLLGGQPPVITGRFRLGDVRHVTADCSAAARVLAWRPTTDLSTGLAGLVGQPSRPAAAV
jgi:dTDP-L-rhamnose 4-epimerase